MASEAPVSNGITDRELEAYYVQHPEEFQQTEQVHLKMFVYARKPKETDFDLVRRLNQHLATLREAERKSDRPEATDTFLRDWGWRERSHLKPALSELVFALPVAQTSEPVLMPDACYLFRVQNRREAGLLSLEEARPKIIERIKREREPKLTFPLELPRV